MGSRRGMHVLVEVPEPALLTFPAQNRNEQMLTQLQSAGLAPAPAARREPDRRRSGAQAGAPVPPSPALVRAGSARRKVPQALIPGAPSGQLTPASAAANVNVPAPGQLALDQRGSRALSPQHPFASAQGSYEYGNTNGDGADGAYAQPGQQTYGRSSPMVASAAPPEVSAVGAGAGEIGAANGDPAQQPEQPSTFWKILTCKCG